MTSIIRLKRQRDEDPIETLMVTCKKFKHDEELQRTCQLTFAGTAKSENDCMRVMKRALQMDALDSFYVCSKPDEESIKVPKRGTKRARPVDDMDIVSSVGAQNLENLFRAKRAKLSLESKQSKFRLLDVEKKTNDKVSGNCVYDIFYVRDPSVADASLDVINFFIHSEDICEQESEDEESKEEIKLEMNYFDDDLEEESYWSKDYPDEFNVFYAEDEEEEEEENDDDDDDDDDDDGDDESRFCKEVQNMYLDNDYGDYIHHFVDSLSKSLLSTKKKSKPKKNSKPKKKTALEGSVMDWD